MVRTVNDIHAALAAFDGRKVGPLKEAVGLPLKPEAEAALLDAVPGADQIGATWMVKALVETGRLSEAQLAEALVSLPNLTEPDAILHLLQSVQYAPGLARALRPDLVPLYRHPRGLVRVWAFDAYCRGAILPEEQGDLAERITQGLRDRSKAMQARSRALAREFGVEIPPKS